MLPDRKRLLPRVKMLVLLYPLLVCKDQKSGRRLFARQSAPEAGAGHSGVFFFCILLSV